MKTRFSLFFISILFFSSLAQAMPAQVLLLRHAEKPEEGNELSDRGWERAKALPALIHRSEFTKFGLPVALYGMAPKKKKSSIRALQTLKYVADDLHLPVIDRFTDNDVDDLVKEVSEKDEYRGKLVVICWNHESIDNIAKGLMKKKGPKYPKEAFDRAWLLTLPEGGEASFEDLPEHLLPGDSER